ncbi:MAG TPA: ATP-grasp domain-containing protein [Candidatus Methanoperedens sp.]
MKILVAEYAVGAGIAEFMLEGQAMLWTLVRSFVSCGHEVLYPTGGMKLNAGEAVITGNFEESIARVSGECDAGLVIAPDEMLGDLTEVIEKNTVNLGCPSDSVRLCADKLECTRALERGNIPVPETIGSGRYSGDYVIKPRYGCASEGIHKSKRGALDEGFIATRFIPGEHLSASLITGRTQLLLTVNRQLIEFNDKISYTGGTVPYYCRRNTEIVETAKKTMKLLGCRGYAGVDIVLGDKPYVVDVNPRPTTSIIGITRVIETEIADLILRAKFGELPESVGVNGSFTFKKEELLRL